MTFKLECIDNQFNKADIYRKRQLIGSIFPKRFQFEKNNVRTTDINPILFKISNINKGLQGNKKREKSKNNEFSLLVHQMNLFSNQNIELFKYINEFIENKKPPT